MVELDEYAHALHSALGNDQSKELEQLLAQAGHDDVLRAELFGVLAETRNGLDAMCRLWEAFGPGPRKTHHPNGRTHSGQPFAPRIRWSDHVTRIRRGNLRAAVRSLLDGGAARTVTEHRKPTNSSKANSAPEEYVIATDLVRDMKGRHNPKAVRRFADANGVDNFLEGRRRKVNRGQFERAWRAADDRAWARIDDVAERRGR